MPTKATKKKPAPKRKPARAKSPDLSHIAADLRGLATEIAGLTMDPANARRHGTRNLETIAASLRQFGQVKPIVVLSDGTVIAGNGTVEAARTLGWTHVAATRFAGADQARAYALADNRTAELADWDIDLLKSQVDELAALDFDVSSIGFDASDIDRIIADMEHRAAADREPPPEITEDEPPPPPKKAITKPGDLWLLGNHRLLCGDSTKPEDVARLMDGMKCDNVVTDPPYGIDFDTDYRRITKGYHSSGKQHDPINGDDEPFDPSPWLSYKHVVLWGGNCFCSHLPLGSWLVWDKRFENGEALLSDAELAWMKGGYGVYIRAITSQGFVRPEKVQHPTQKPVALMAWCIEISKATDPIFDPYSGSGTTLIAAEQLGRRCFAMEIEPKYVDVAVARWEKLTGRKAERVK